MADGKPSVILGALVSCKCSDSAIESGRIVQLDTSATDNQETVVKAATADTTIPIGVTTTATSAADQEVTVQISGITQISMDGSTVLTTSKIVSAAAGQGAVSTTEDATNQWCIGLAHAPSTAANDRIPVQIAIFPLNKGTA